jgi:hypothetical protein
MPLEKIYIPNEERGNRFSTEKRSESDLEYQLVQPLVDDWIDIEKETPTLEDCGTYFLVAIKMVTGIEYQVTEWFNADDGETAPSFNIEHGYCGSQMINRAITHWKHILPPPNKK